MKVKLIDLEPVHVAYLRYTGAYGPPSGISGWRKSRRGWKTNNLMGVIVTASSRRPERHEARAVPLRRLRRESGG